MKKILLSTVLVVLILVLSTTFVFAAKTQLEEATEKADVLYNMGLFKGTDEGYELDREPTRIEALVMLIRLLGKENAALSCTYTHPFTDVPSWADKYVAYGYKKGLTNGVSDTAFGSNQIASSNMYLTFVLRSLGYSDTNNADFSWDNPNSLAKQKGLIDTSSSTNFYRGDVVLISYKSLTATIKSSDTTLYNKLHSEGAVSSSSGDLIIFSVTEGTEQLSKDTTNACEVEQALKITATPSDFVDSIQYYWEEEGSSSRKTVNSYYKTIYVPEDFEEGEEYTLCIRAKDENATYTNWIKYQIQIGESGDIDKATGIEIKIYNGLTTLSTSKTYEYPVETKLDIETTPVGQVDYIQYYWVENGVSSKEKIVSYKGKIEIPDDFDEGEIYTLRVRVYTTNKAYTDWKDYEFEINDGNNVSEDDVVIKLSKGTTKLSTTKTYDYGTGTNLSIKATPSSEIQSIQYYWSNTTSSNKKTVESYSTTIEIPEELKNGYTYYLYIRAYTEDYEYTDWYKYTFKINGAIGNDIDDVDIKVTKGTTALSTSQTYNYDIGTDLTIGATPSSYIQSIQYYWSNTTATNKTIVNSYTSSIKIPSTLTRGNTYYLYVRAYTDDYAYTSWKAYTFKITQEKDDSTGLLIDVKYGSTPLSSVSSNSYMVGTTLNILVNPTSSVDSIQYYWDVNGSSSKTTVSSYTTSLTIPTTFTLGETYTLIVRATNTSGNITDWKEYEIKIAEENTNIDGTPDIYTVLYKGSAASSNRLYTGTTYNCEKGTNLILNGSTATKTSTLEYYWLNQGSDNKTTVRSSTATIPVPSTFEIAQTYTLYVRAKDTNGDWTNWETYVFKIDGNLEVNIAIRKDGVVLSNSQTIEAMNEEELIIRATPANNVTYLQYAWDTKTSLTSITNYTTTIAIPSSFVANSIHTLNVRVYDANGDYTDIITYTFKIVKNATSVEINKSTLSLTVGASETLSATILPTTATNKTIEWISTDTRVATVDSNGRVTAISAGNANIQATTSNGIFDRCVVTVTAPAPAES